MPNASDSRPIPSTARKEKGKQAPWVILELQEIRLVFILLCSIVSIMCAECTCTYV